MNVLKLAESIGEALGVPTATAQVIARFGRDAGILTNRGRGRNVADASSLDAAFLTIAMLTATRPGMATMYMEHFGTLRPIQLFTAIAEGHSEFVSARFPPGHTFAAGLSALFDALGDALFVQKIYAFNQTSAGKRRQPRMEVVIRETELKASLKFDLASFGYEHHAYQLVDLQKAAGEKDDIERAKHLARAEVAASIGDHAKELFHRPVKTSAAIEAEQIIEIAAAVNGVSFWELLAEHAERDKEAGNG